MPCRIYCDIQLEVDDDSKLRSRWQNKKRNAEAENIVFQLTFEEYCQLVKDANLVSSRLGFKGENYVLARYNDQGGYTYGNCRFITQKENIAEKRYSDRMKSSNLKKAEIMREKRRSIPKDQWVEKMLESRFQNPAYKQKPQLRQAKEQDRLLHLDPRWAGERNSAYGCRWITDGNVNQFWNPKKCEIPEGFHLGRVSTIKNT